MTKRRSRGDGGLHWDANRQRWIATITVGYDARGKRITRKASGKSKTDAKSKLRERSEATMTVYHSTATPWQTLLITG